MTGRLSAPTADVGAARRAPALRPVGPATRPAGRLGRGLLALRLVLVAAGVGVAATAGAVGTAPVAVGAVLAVGHAIVVVWRVSFDRDLTVTTVVLDLLVTGVVVAVTGGLESPFGPVLAADIAAAGLLGGYRAAAVAALASMAAATAATPVAPDVVGDPVRTALVVLVAVALGGFARNVTHQDAGYDQSLGAVDTLADTNRLLADVHATLQTLPAAPDLGSVAAAALDSLRERVPFTAGVVLLRDDDAGWRCVHAEGTHAHVLDLPPLLADAGDQPVLSDDLGRDGGGLASGSASGAYLPLTLRGRHIGWLALEHDEPARYDDEHATALVGLRDPLALALDNARLMSRVGRLSGEFERGRLARDLHDRLCQSLAAMGVSLQRAALRAGDDDLGRLAELVRDDIADLRETLYELRAGPDGDHALAEVLSTYTRRFAERTGVHVDLVVDAPERLSLVVEQQLFRIVQEGLRNVERHAGATAVDVTWRVHGGRARLEIGDDGCGFDPDEPAPADRVGLRSVRERAAAVGADLELVSFPDDAGGTVLAVSLG